jgi:cystathionine beta-lyase/cystathionine gamma-synthase
MLSSFGEDACGRVYAVSLDGPVYRLAQSGPAQGGECGPPPGVSPPAPAPSDVAPETVDRTAPVVRLVAAARQRPWRTGVVALQASCDEVCDLTARGTFVLGRRRTLATTAKVTLRTATVTSRLAAGTTVTVQAKVSGRTRRSLLRALRRHRGVTVRFIVAATDPAGNAARGTARSQISLH